jgi:hypothetical protein
MKLIDKALHEVLDLHLSHEDSPNYRHLKTSLGWPLVELAWLPAWA